MLLRDLFEAPGKTAVLAFGRLNPPTIGHAKLVDAITAQEGDHYLFLSQTQKPKTDPLDFATKLKFAKKFFPSINVGHSSVRTPVQALEMLQGLGYTDLIFVAGSDRVDGFQNMFDTYNGKPDKTGKIPFKFNYLEMAILGKVRPPSSWVIIPHFVFGPIFGYRMSGDIPLEFTNKQNETYYDYYSGDIGVSAYDLYLGGILGLGGSYRFSSATLLTLQFRYTASFTDQVSGDYTIKSEDFDILLGLKFEKMETTEISD